MWTIPLFGQVEFLAFEHFSAFQLLSNRVEHNLMFLVICNMHNFWKSKQTLSLVKVTGSFLENFNDLLKFHGIPRPIGVILIDYTRLTKLNDVIGTLTGQ